jgi:putative membrane protein
VTARRALARREETAMRALAIAAALIALTAPPAAGQAGNPAGMKPATPQSAPGKPAPNEPNAQDRLFCQLVGAGGMAEVDAGRLAEQKASNAAVKDFARRMVQDHSRANEQLAALARAAKVPLPDALDPDHQAQRAELDKLSGGAFDLAYVHGQLIEHQKAATLLQWEIGSGQDAELQRFAMQTLPVVLEHLEMAQALAARLTGAAPQGLAAASSPGPSRPRATAPGRTAREIPRDKR